MNTFIIWLVLVVAWNYGYPKASPLEDVIVAIILSLFTSVLKKYLKFNQSAEKINVLIICNCLHF